jgi:nuclear cap-binding protein subunit 1
LKIPFVAAIVLLANSQKPEFTSEILQKVGEALQKCLDTSSWREVKLYLRFLGCLQGLFENEGIFAILEVLFSRAVDLQTQSSEDVSHHLLSHPTER